MSQQMMPYNMAYELLRTSMFTLKTLPLEQMKELVQKKLEDSGDDLHLMVASGLAMDVSLLDAVSAFMTSLDSLFADGQAHYATWKAEHGDEVLPDPMQNVFIMVNGGQN